MQQHSQTASRRELTRATSKARLTPPTELRSVASYGGKRSTGASLRLKLRSKDRPYEIIMKDIKRLARNFFTEEEYAQFIEEQKALLAHEPDTESDLPPLSFMLFMHDIYGLSRDEMGIVDGSVRLTLKAGKRIAQQRLRESDVTPDLQDQIMDIIQVIESHEE